MAPGLVHPDRRVLSPLAPGHRPGVSLPWLDRYQFRVTLNLPCDGRPRGTYMVAQYRLCVHAHAVRFPASRTASMIAWTSYFRIVRMRREVCQVT